MRYPNPKRHPSTVCSGNVEDPQGKEDILIHNSEDKSILIPEELRGRVIEQSFLTGLTMNDTNEIH